MSTTRFVVPIGLALGVVACRVGPEHRVPHVDVPGRYAAASDDSAAPPLDAKWWTVFGDATLDELEEAALAHDTDLAAAAARVVQARARAGIASGALLPSVAIDPSFSRARTSTTRASGTTTQIRLPLDVAYEVDLWGRLRNAESVAVAAAQASAADFGTVRITLTSDVAQQWFVLRALDAQQTILARSIELFARELALRETQQRVGVGAQIEVAQARTQLESSRAQEIDVRRQRADAEHALATLTGRAPEDLSLAASALAGEPPSIPPGLPTDLLRRRPDVASAERTLASATAAIGVAEASFYPALTLTGSAGFESSRVEDLLDPASRVWSFLAGLTAPLFQGGALDAREREALARWDEAAATFRGTVLVALREVEDALTDLHLHAEGSAAQERAVAAAQDALKFARVQYDQGLANYLVVIDAERTLLTNELTLLTLRQQRFAACVLLCKALGGGWRAGDDASDPRTREASGPR